MELLGSVDEQVELGRENQSSAVKKENQCPDMDLNKDTPACGDNISCRLDITVWFHSKKISPSYGKGPWLCPPTPASGPFVQ